MANIRTRDIVTYMTLPQIGPRLRDFMGDGFATLAYIVASIYNAVGILPRNHPYLQSAQIGNYTIMQVMAEAQKNLRFDRKHIDQVIIYFAIMLGMVLIGIQFFLVLLTFFAKSAYAGGIPIDNFLGTENPDQDIAFRLLDMVFGIPNMFGSEELSYLNVMADFHGALHGMFIIYSIAIIVVAGVIISYFIGAVLLETAQTGTPFGKRYNHVWVPIRIITAIGLLIPISYGMNAGQFVTLYAAKWGSGFATNGWIYFNENLGGGSTYLGDQNTLIAAPQAPEAFHLQVFSSIVNACSFAYEDEGVTSYNYDIEAYIVTGVGAAAAAVPFLGTTFEQAMQIAGPGNTIHVKIGHLDPTYSEEIGMVKGLCGELFIDWQNITEPGFLTMAEGYYGLAQNVVTGQGFAAGCMADAIFNYTYAIGTTHPMVLSPESVNRDATGFLEDTYFFLNEALDEEYAAIVGAIETCILQAQAELAASDTWAIDEDGLNLGWAGAAIWYNKIAQMNGGFVSTINALPRIEKYPTVMEYVQDQKMQQDDNIDPSTRFDPNLEQGRRIQFADPRDGDMARVLNVLFQYWERRGYNSGTEEIESVAPQSNAFIDAINAVLGTRGLFDMCQNADIHPLAQLAVLGKSLIENSIRNFGYSIASGAMGGLGYLLNPHIGAGLDAMSGFFTGIASTTLTIGFVLYYVLPFMPFLYFFFAVGGWIKGIFEAMVGVPLWALAHLRIDGELLPGKSGNYGNFLILEIFLRPFLIVVGLLASITIFAAMVRVLNEIFPLAVSNISGHDPGERVGCVFAQTTGLQSTGSEMFLRGPVDEFFFTIMYAVIVYLIGMSSFKLIDQIPNQIMRWLGQSVQTFNDQNSSAPDGLIMSIVVKGGMISGNLQGAAGHAKSAISSLGSGIKQNLQSGDE